MGGRLGGSLRACDAHVSLVDGSGGHRRECVLLWRRSQHKRKKRMQARAYIVRELLDTERNYVQSLQTVIEVGPGLQGMASRGGGEQLRLRGGGILTPRERSSGDGSRGTRCIFSCLSSRSRRQRTRTSQSSARLTSSSASASSRTY